MCVERLVPHVAGGLLGTSHILFAEAQASVSKVYYSIAGMTRAARRRRFGDDGGFTKAPQEQRLNSIFLNLLDSIISFSCNLVPPYRVPFFLCGCCMCSCCVGVVECTPSTKCINPRYTGMILHVRIRNQG